MAYYDALAAVWAAGRPSNATGTPFSAGMDAAGKLAAVNSWQVPKDEPDPALLEPSAILNAIVPADLAALTQIQVLFLSMLLSGARVDASQGTTIRTAVQTIFAGKTQTLQNLGALVAPFDNPREPWWQANGYSSPISETDIEAAGLA